MSTWLVDLNRGILKENPVFRLLLGMCPVLGVTALAETGLGMGIAATLVLICSNVVISTVRNYLPARVRIPCFIVIIATFVTLVDMILEAFQPELHDQLGIFVPLIVVNCMILGRAEAFASKRPILRSFFDGLGVGIGFTLALVMLAIVREVLGQGTLFGLDITGAAFEPMLVMALPPGAFIALGVLLAIMNIAFKRFQVE